MKVILLDYVYKQGVAGEVIDVADGYARNFLIPRKLAAKATVGELKRAGKLRDQAVAKRAALENRLSEVASIIDGVELVFGRRAATTGKLFGSVTTQEIAESLLNKTGVDINRRRISQQGLREIGVHDVPVRMGTETSPTLKIVIVREDELQGYIASKAAAEARAKAAAEAGPEAQPEAEEEVPAEVAQDLPTEVLPMDAVRAAVDDLRQAEVSEQENSDS